MKTVGWFIVAAAAATVAGVRADNWAQWRGPFFNGSAEETGLPSSWGTNENVTWSTPLPGASGATPAVWDNTVFVTSPDAEQNLLLFCIDRNDGAVRWRKKLASGNISKGNNNMASPSPVTDGKTVFAMFGTGHLAALDFSGTVLWERDLGKDFGKFSVMWLYGSSPLLFKDRLYVQVLQRSPSSYPHSKDGREDRESYLLCIDPKTGRDLWRRVRPTDALNESMESYATPIPFEGPDGTELLVIGGDCVTGHKPDTGEELWRCLGLNPKRDPWWRVVPSAVACDGLIVACSPKRTPMFAIRGGGKGAITDTHTAWRFDGATPDVCTPLYYRGKLFVLDGDRRTVACLDPKTGTPKWQGDLSGTGILRASPTGADGKIYIISESGVALVLDAGDEFKILSTIQMGQGPCRASIAISDGQLFIRTGKTLYGIGKRKPGSPP